MQPNHTRSLFSDTTATHVQVPYTSAVFPKVQREPPLHSTKNSAVTGRLLSQLYSDSVTSSAWVRLASTTKLYRIRIMIIVVVMVCFAFSASCNTMISLSQRCFWKCSDGPAKIKFIWLYINLADVMDTTERFRNSSPK